VVTQFGIWDEVFRAYMYTCPCAHPVWHVTWSERRAARAQTAVLRSTRLYMLRVINLRAKHDKLERGGLRETGTH